MAPTSSAFFATKERVTSSAYGSIMTISSFAERTNWAANSYPLHQDFAFSIPSLGGKFALTKKSTSFQESAFAHQDFQVYFHGKLTAGLQNRL